MQRGKFMIIDGPSGSGKSALIGALCQELTARDKTYLFIAEHHDPRCHTEEIARAQKEKRDDAYIASLFIQARKTYYADIVSPMLAHGTLVIANRGEPSTLAYQTRDHTTTIAELYARHRELHIPAPDHAIITLCHPEISYARQVARHDVREAHEKKLSGKFSHAESHEDAMNTIKQITSRYEEVVNFLQGIGIETTVIHTDQLSLVDEVAMVMKIIDQEE
jgi:thymidylate kinase